jgi:hypothetical protein
MPASPQKHLIIAYHADCLDGLASAWVFDRKWGSDPALSLSYVPYGHYAISAAEEKINSLITAHADIYFVDVAPRRKFLDRLMTCPAASVTIIDHHKSAVEKLQHHKPPKTDSSPALRMHLDSTAPSASGMVWRLLLPDQAPPVFFGMIEKMDLSTNLITKEDYAAAATIDSKRISDTSRAFESFGQLSGLSLVDMITHGEDILLDQQRRIYRLTENIMYTKLDLPADAGLLPEKWIPVINADVQNFGRTISRYLIDQGRKSGAGIALAWYVQGNGVVTMSLRSDGSPDCSQVVEAMCAHMGTPGGGHSTSAAVNFKSLPDFYANVPLTAVDKI